MFDTNVPKLRVEGPIPFTRSNISNGLDGNLIETASPASGECPRNLFAARSGRRPTPSQKMVLRNAIIEAELVEQLALVPPLPTHHRPVPRRRSRQQTESPFGATLNAFIDSIDPNRTCRAPEPPRLRGPHC